MTNESKVVNGGSDDTYSNAIQDEFDLASARGYAAWSQRQTERDCPYGNDDESRKYWMWGWKRASGDSKNKMVEPYALSTEDYKKLMYKYGLGPAVESLPIEPPVLKCEYCGGSHTTKCSLVKAYNYHPDGSLARVEFYSPIDYPTYISATGIPNTTRSGGW
jgi:ribosome modulation factor